KSSSRIQNIFSSSDDTQKGCTVGMAGMVLSLLSSTWFPLDLSAHQDALILTGNLLAGKGKRNIPSFLLLASEHVYLTLLGKILGRLGRRNRDRTSHS
uniref:Uncharacterized protein n=1 Tax=Meleagris gallopavo TaxID=9103 RepID=A0A803YPZ1_MELGA